MDGPLGNLFHPPPFTIPAVDEAGPLFGRRRCGGGLAVGDAEDARQEEEEGDGGQEALRVGHHLAQVAEIEMLYLTCGLYRYSKG